ncbi:hypothetical protein ABZ864_47770 [Streptomyces sp. NPDC047082]|uniref:hypothetical protein n=1 Tax=Streptomyces sp. NPDC047082 TaxID=3155259 RepID=UPI0033D2FFB5
METGILQHPLIARTIDAIVADQGGCVQYDLGCGGREVLVAASARLAAVRQAPLTIVEAPALHTDVAATAAELQPDVHCTVLSAQEAARRPEHRGGVLAVHADTLRDPDVRRPLLDLARAADHLVVARHDDSDTTLDAAAGPLHTVTHADLEPNLPPHVMEAPDRLSDLWGGLDRKQHLIGQITQPLHPESDGAAPALDGAELARLMESGYRFQLTERARRLRDQLAGLAAERAAPTEHHAPRARTQQQSAPHQQPGHQGLSRG